MERCKVARHYAKTWMHLGSFMRLAYLLPVVAIVVPTLVSKFYGSAPIIYNWLAQKRNYNGDNFRCVPESALQSFHSPKARKVYNNHILS